MSQRFANSQWQEEREEAKRLNAAAAQARRQAEAPVTERREPRRQERAVAGITYLDEPVAFGVHGRCRVVGVCSDAPDSVKEMYGVSCSPPVASPASLQSLADRSQRRRSQARAMARA